MHSPLLVPSVNELIFDLSERPLKVRLTVTKLDKLSTYSFAESAPSASKVMSELPLNMMTPPVPNDQEPVSVTLVQPFASQRLPLQLTVPEFVKSAQIADAPESTTRIPPFVNLLLISAVSSKVSFPVEETVNEFLAFIFAL